MKDNDSKEYIKFLENKVLELQNKSLADELERFLKMQDDLVALQFENREKIILQNRILTDQVHNLQKMIALDFEYIDFLMNSIWWKLSLPFRIFSRNRIKKKYEKRKINFSIDNEINEVPIDKKITIIISTYNAGVEFPIQLDYLLKQKLLNNYNIVVIDRGSIDDTVSIAKEKNVNTIDLFNIRDEECFIETSIISNSDYVIYLDQNKIIEDDYWIFKAIKPIENNQANLTAVYDAKFKKEIEKMLKDTLFHELKKRFVLIDNNYFLYFPSNRNNIQYVNPWVLDHASIVVKKINSEK